MKYKAIFFVFFIGFLVNGFCQESADYTRLLNDIRDLIKNELGNYGEDKSPQGNLVPLTWDIVKAVDESNKKDEFKKLDYYLSTDFILTASSKEINSNSGGLVIDYGDTVTMKKISRKIKGEFVGEDRKKDEESFIIKFQEQNIRFKRNMQTGRFYADSAMGIQYTFEGSRPYLCIYLEQKGAVNPLSKAALKQSTTSSIPAGFQRTEQFPVFIMGDGILGRDIVVSYIMSKNPAMTRQQILGLIDEYIKEAERERINHDIAIAQMCHATRFLSNQKLLGTHNYAGLNADKGISVKYFGKHASMQEGVRAHIQHLKGYASRERPRQLVDRRYDLLVASGICGTVVTLDDLFATWSPYDARGYGNEIRKILGELYQFSGRYI